MKKNKKLPFCHFGSIVNNDLKSFIFNNLFDRVMKVCQNVLFFARQIGILESFLFQ
jgi:hypothetical protein